MLKLTLTQFVQNPKLATEQSAGKTYLCVKNNYKFVASMRLLKNPDRTMPANCDAGCIYVDDVCSKRCVPIDKLDEIYEIEEKMRMLKDNKGRELPYNDVWELAYDNAMNSGEGTGPTLKNYIDDLSDEDLLQWATDEKGNFLTQQVNN